MASNRMSMASNAFVKTFTGTYGMKKPPKGSYVSLVKAARDPSRPVRAVSFGPDRNLPMNRSSDRLEPTLSIIPNRSSGGGDIAICEPRPHQKSVRIVEGNEE